MPVAPWWEEFSSSTSAVTPSADTSSARTPSPGAASAVQVRRAPRRRPRGLLALQLSAAVLSVALVALLAVITVRGGGPSTAGPAAAGPTSPAVASSLPGASGPDASGPGASGPGASGPGATDDAAALQQLEALRARGLAGHPPTGQWAAQLAAKSIGTTDPAQVAANGSHTFYAGDILAQSRRIADGPAGSDVFVLRSDDYGKGSVDARGNPYWTTLAAGPFASAADVRTWCDSVFGDVPAATRGNVCLPRQLLPVR